MRFQSPNAARIDGAQVRGNTQKRDAAAKRDWRTYDRWRPEWDRLPANRHSCACHTNDIGTCDGLRALAARRLAALPQHLAAAADVRAGCPHLNTGGLRLDLVRTMVARRLHLDACRTYLEHAVRFCATKELGVLQQKVAGAIARRAGRRQAPARR